MLITGATLLDGRVADIRAGERITEVAPLLQRNPDEPVFDAHGCTVIPGLHDHHVHLYAAAAALDSVPVGPAEVTTAEGLRRVLQAAAVGPDGWVRAVGYHDAVAGPLDRVALDELRNDAPVRVQHRSGSVWFLNSAGLAVLGRGDHPDGVLRSDDPALSALIGRRDISLTAVSRMLTGYGVTGVTDATPDGGGDVDGEVVQHVTWLAPGKKILHDDALDLDGLASWITVTHRDGSPVALHCVTSRQLVVAVAALQAAGTAAGDRIEHAAVVPSDMMGRLAGLGVTVVTQPNFIAERGDQYLADVDPHDLDGLWRLGSLLRSGVRTAISTDMPFGGADPWACMRAAVTRCTPSGQLLGPQERVSAQQALLLFLGSADRPDVPRSVQPGQPGDVCVLRGTPADVLDVLDSSMVVGTIRAGTLCSAGGGTEPGHQIPDGCC